MVSMFIRPIYVRKNGKRHAYWAPVKSERTDRGPRHWHAALDAGYLSGLAADGAMFDVRVVFCLQTLDPRPSYW